MAERRRGPPLSRPVVDRAGSALFWQGVQHVGAKTIYVVRIPVLARLLSPADFGLMAIAIIAVEFLMHVTNFGMVPALVQRERAERRHYDAAWTVGILRALMVSVAVFLAAPLIATIFGEPRAEPVIRLLALRPILQASASIRIADLTRDLQFRGLAALSLTEALASTAVSVVLAPWYGVWALAFGALAGPTFHAVLSYLLAPYRPALRLEREAAGGLIRFGRWIFLIGIIGLAGRSVLQAIISRRLGAPELGRYFMAGKIAFLPTEIASQLIGAVAFPLYARLQTDREAAARTFRTLAVGMAALLLPVLALLIGLAPSLVEDVLGPRWQGTAVIIVILAVRSMIGLPADAAEPIFKGLGQPQRNVLLEVVQTSILLALLWPMTGWLGLAGAAACWLPATAVPQIISARMLTQVLPRPFSGLLRPLGVVAAISLLGGVAALLVDRAVGGLVGFALAVGASSSLMGVALWAADRRLRLGLLEMLGQVLPFLRPWLSRPRKDGVTR